MIADIARRVKKMERFTETAELMAKHMVEQGYSAVKIRAEVMKYLRADKNYQEAIAKNTKEYKEGIQKIIEETVEKAKEEGNKLIAEAGNMAWNNDLSMWEEHGEDLERPNSLSQLIAAFGQQTSGELRNLTRSTGFKHTVLGTTGVLQAFQREMDLATLKVATGTFSYDVAVNDCIKRLAQSGLRKIDYKSGRSYQLDTAARMCVRTGASQLAGKITEMNLDIMDHDLVITSQHMASRPEHAPIQNKVFSFSGKNKKYPSFKDSLGKGGAGYGTAEGIKGTNCTHNYYPYWEGDIIPKDIDYDPKVYENTQKQRAMERKIRATKREIEAQNAIGGDTTELKAKLKKQNKDYFAFSKKVGIRPKENRLVVISGSSELKKGKNDNTEATKKKEINTKSIEKKRDSDIIELQRKISDSRKNFKFINDKTFDNLTIEARKKGALVIRGTKEVEEHLDKMGAAASNIGNILMFRKEVCISEVLEETYHFHQNISKMNDDKGQMLRTILNEIDAKKYILENAKKFKVPRNELELTKKQLISYEKQLEKYYDKEGEK